MTGFEFHQIVLAVSVTLFAGFVKGAIGFAMPMIMMSAFTAFLPPPVALALLILPTFVTNLMQAFRQGSRAAIESALAFRLHIAAVLVFLFLSAQFVTGIPKAPMEAALGLPILGFALWQLSGRPMALKVEHRARAELGLGVIGGLYGGISGIWGPPLIVLLLSLRTDKQEMMRVQGVVFLIGSAALFAAHLTSGVLNAETLPVSALLVIPALLGNRLGLAIQDRLDQQKFRRWTLILLAVTGANLIRQALS
ncbi:sulfite exporter TauE/SafE family protein [Frigidibacter sp. RF13]|uniref:sulfite exporter TauE/SafE family protein n=1 Tax=Frigidibacter sp. RF13 TaxID=2997340 RepID=UPI002270D532|nr:sulfite exporter TauE/SafE family protein [Frigidibacter sp. RF13]MCY1127614.1 sulfite exporter TauE/SafE family protein [Frigidibacter sp. RF13]